MHKKPLIIASTIIAVLLLGLVIFSACSQKSPTSPYSSIPGPSYAAVPQEEPKSLSTTEDFKVTCQSDFTVVYATLLDLLRLVNVTLTCDSSKLVFPVGSVPSLVTILGSVEQGLSNREGFVTRLNFFPDGLIFLKPLELHYRSASPEGREIKFYWYDPLAGVWKLEQTDKVKNGKVVFYIRHFSKYKVVDGSTSNGSERY